VPLLSDIIATLLAKQNKQNKRILGGEHSPPAIAVENIENIETLQNAVAVINLM
jgi:hypothetical protein